ncbi:hypothetical protein EW026_g7889 [Hermanssonia centrifuga]|uniref:Uncharacterized protein n=1 Tax=Hermanssonia centrifuga TaxID=98765 RepID=A0A4S4K6B5_9APHY|nr:hypothetical protein EW026_g7889 [Hermanssonia centrifuga]
MILFTFPTIVHCFPALSINISAPTFARSSAIVPGPSSTTTRLSTDTQANLSEASLGVVALSLNALPTLPRPSVKQAKSSHPERLTVAVVLMVGFILLVPQVAIHIQLTTVILRVKIYKKFKDFVGLTQLENVVVHQACEQELLYFRYRRINQYAYSADTSIAFLWQAIQERVNSSNNLSDSYEAVKTSEMVLINDVASSNAYTDDLKSEATLRISDIHSQIYHERERHVQELAHSDAILSSLQQHIDLRDDDLDRLLNAYNIIRASEASLSDEVADLNTELFAVKQAHDVEILELKSRIEKEHEEHRTAFTNFMETITALGRDIRILESDLNIALRSAQDAQERYTVAERQLEFSQLEYKCLLEDLPRQHAIAEAKLSAVQADHDELAEKYEEQASRLKLTQVALGETSEESARKHAAFRAYQAAHKVEAAYAEGLEETIDEQRIKIVDLEESYKTLETRYDEQTFCLRLVQASLRDTTEVISRDNATIGAYRISRKIEADYAEDLEETIERQKLVIADLKNTGEEQKCKISDVERSHDELQIQCDLLKEMYANAIAQTLIPDPQLAEKDAEIQRLQDLVLHEQQEKEAIRTAADNDAVVTRNALLRKLSEAYDHGDRLQEDLKRKDAAHQVKYEDLDSRFKLAQAALEQSTEVPKSSTRARRQSAPPLSQTLLTKRLPIEQFLRENEALKEKNSQLEKELTDIRSKFLCEASTIKQDDLTSVSPSSISSCPVTPTLVHSPSGFSDSSSILATPQMDSYELDTSTCVAVTWQLCSSEPIVD